MTGIDSSDQQRDDTTDEIQLCWGRAVPGSYVDLDGVTVFTDARLEVVSITLHPIPSGARVLTSRRVDEGDVAG